MPIDISHPPYQFRQLSNDFIQSLVVDGVSYNSVTNFVYTNLLVNNAYKVKYNQSPSYEKFKELKYKEYEDDLEKIIRSGYDIYINSDKTRVDMIVALISTENRKLVYNKPFLSLKNQKKTNIIGKILMELRSEWVKKLEINDIENIERYNIYKAMLILTSIMRQGKSIASFAGKDINEIIEQYQNDMIKKSYGVIRFTSMDNFISKLKEGKENELIYGGGLSDVLKNPSKIFFHVIGNNIETSQKICVEERDKILFREFYAYFNKQKSGTNITMVINALPEKEHDLLLENFKKLYDQKPDVLKKTIDSIDSQYRDNDLILYTKGEIEDLKSHSELKARKKDVVDFKKAIVDVIKTQKDKKILEVYKLLNQRNPHDPIILDIKKEIGTETMTDSKLIEIIKRKVISNEDIRKKIQDMISPEKTELDISGIEFLDPNPDKITPNTYLIYNVYELPSIIYYVLFQLFLNFIINRDEYSLQSGIYAETLKDGKYFKSVMVLNEDYMGIRDKRLIEASYKLYERVLEIKFNIRQNRLVLASSSKYTLTYKPTSDKFLEDGLYTTVKFLDYERKDSQIMIYKDKNVIDNAKLDDYLNSITVNSELYEFIDGKFSEICNCINISKKYFNGKINISNECEFIKDFFDFIYFKYDNVISENLVIKRQIPTSFNQVLSKYCNNISNDCKEMIYGYITCSMAYLVTMCENDKITIGELYLFIAYMNQFLSQSDNRCKVTVNIPGSRDYNFSDNGNQNCIYSAIVNVLIGVKMLFEKYGGEIRINIQVLNFAMSIIFNSNIIIDSSTTKFKRRREDDTKIKFMLNDIFKLILSDDNEEMILNWFTNAINSFKSIKMRDSDKFNRINYFATLN